MTAQNSNRTSDQIEKLARESGDWRLAFYDQREHYNAEIARLRIALDLAKTWLPDSYHHILDEVMASARP